MKFCANISMLFQDLPLEQRIHAAKQAGFDGVEILFPYDGNAATLSARLTQSGMPLALINSPPPNYAGGPRGFAADPNALDRFRRDLPRVLRYAKSLGADHIHLMAGTAAGPQAHECFVENLRHATNAAPEQSFTIEPINPHDMPGYFLTDYSQALDILQTVDAPNLHLQFDAYHAHRITGDVHKTWDRCAKHVRHVQIADHPGRHEPGSGEIDYLGFFAQLAEHGYNGWTSAEYIPSGATTDSLEWLPR